MGLTACCSLFTARMRWEPRLLDVRNIRHSLCKKPQKSALDSATAATATARRDDSLQRASGCPRSYFRSVSRAPEKLERKVPIRFVWAVLRGGKLLDGSRRCGELIRPDPWGPLIRGPQGQSQSHAISRSSRLYK